MVRQKDSAMVNGWFIILSLSSLVKYFFLLYLLTRILPDFLLQVFLKYIQDNAPQLHMYINMEITYIVDFTRLLIIVICLYLLHTIPCAHPLLCTHPVFQHCIVHRTLTRGLGHSHFPVTLQNQKKGQPGLVENRESILN